MHIYNIADDSWTIGHVAPTSAYRYTSQLYNGKIYCPETSGTAIHIYDITDDSWTTGHVAPTSVGRHTSQLYNGKIYCPENRGTAMHIYNISDDSWSTGEDAPTSAYRYTSQLYNGKIYCPENNGTAMHIYNIADDSWTIGHVAPASAKRYTSQLYDGKIYCPEHLGIKMHIYIISVVYFIYDGVVKGTVTAGSKSMCVFNNKIIIMPDKKYYDFITDTFGTIGTGVYPASGSCPDIDYICEYNNRLWGVKGNSIYASKLGDYSDWTTFLGLETDAYATDVATPGSFTGIYPYANHVVMTKPDCLHELYGYKPSNFTIQKTTDKGCIYGKTIVEINGVLYFEGRDGIYAYTGSIPRPISANLNETYNVASAGRFGNYYYLSLYNGTNYNLYIYDTFNGIWVREDDLNIKDFTLLDGALYALGADNKIYKFDSGNETIDWEVETEIFTEKISEKKGHSQITLMIDLEQGSTLNIYYKINNGDYYLGRTFNNTGLQVVHTYMIPQRAEHFQIKLTGTGKFKLYEIERKFFYGSDV
jgi:hypothetical protein